MNNNLIKAGNIFFIINVIGFLLIEGHIISAIIFIWFIYSLIYEQKADKD